MEIAERVSPREYVLLYVIYRLGRVVTATKLQKLLFLILHEGKIPTDYRFRLHFYGPYEKQINSDTLHLKHLSLIHIEDRLGAHDYEYRVYSITPLGVEFVKKHAIKRLKRYLPRIDRLLEKYGNKSYAELKEYVYSKYVEDITPGEVIKRSRKLIAQSQQLQDIWYSEHYQQLCPIALVVLSYLEYSQRALEKIAQVKDPVERKVLFYACADVIEMIEYITPILQHDTCPMGRDRFKILPEFVDSVAYLEYYCNKIGILKPMGDEEFDWSEFIDEGDAERVIEAIGGKTHS